MNGSNQNEYNRLYLLKEDKNKIFLNNCHLIKQHQIDGLRFLFRQFKKKKPVAVVNFPEECGKTVTVALFLSAISGLLKKPVLIICNNETEIEHWKEIILKWSEYNIDDIAIEPSNVYIKKKIFLKTSADLVSYQRPNWSIVIIKEVSKSLLKLTFNADLKIWITFNDVKKDVATLACFYNWCLPMSKSKPTMNPNDFIPSGNKMKEKLEKAILLDSYIEDFVIQETRIEPFTKKWKSNSSIADTKGGKEKTPQKSRKNKDATGTKIKRSRRILDDDIIESKENESINNDNESQNILLNFDTESLVLNDDVNQRKQVVDENGNKNADKSEEGLGDDKENFEISDQNSEMKSQSICLDYDELENNMEVLEETKDGVKSQTHGSRTQDENVAETFANDNKEKETDNIKQSPEDMDISEWEAKALKKFKGSLLDSIF